MKTIATIINIRPDIIRLAHLIKKLDKKFNHVLISSGQHFQKELHDNFFDEFDLRYPDYNLCAGAHGKEPMQMVADAWKELKPILSRTKPDTIIILGDANGTLLSVPIKKEGYHFTRVETGMRTGDMRMPEEINRICADHMADILFAYTENSAKILTREGIDGSKIYVVGNTIIEPTMAILNKYNVKALEKSKNFILADIHRHENLVDGARLQKVIDFISYIGYRFELPIRLIGFQRLLNVINEFKIIMWPNIYVVPLMPFKDHLTAEYHAFCIISDSGTDQEQPALFNTPVLVPRTSTERPESIENNCSMMVDPESSRTEAIEWVNRFQNEGCNTKWLGTGNTSKHITNILEAKL